MRQLDALRAFAIGGVLLVHFLPVSCRLAPWGEIGVRLFFVVSGFLITGILLRSRDQVEATGESPLFAMRSFYMRRVLRIFPIYYLALLVAWCFNIEPARQTLLWHAAYLSNLYTTVTGEMPGALTPYWTLAVEEQFYLIWPLVVLFLPRKYLLPVIVGTVVLGPAVRLGGVLLDITSFRVGRLPLACLDTLGLGALLALCGHPGSGVTNAAKRLNALALPVGIPLFLISLFVHITDFNHLPFALPTWLGKFSFVVFDLGLGLLSVRLVASAAIGFRGVTGALLNLPALIYIGGISYGIYVFHPFAQMLVLGHLSVVMSPPSIAFAALAAILGLTAWCTARHSSRQAQRLGSLLLIETICAATAFLFHVAGVVGLPLRYQEMGFYVAMATGGAIAFAGLSWHVLEQPLLRLKDRFPYVRKAGSR